MELFMFVNVAQDIGFQRRLKMINEDKFLFVERYRPKTVSECILPDHLKNPFLQYVKQGSVPNLILTGSPGVGKTTVAMAMCEEIGADYILINASLESGIDTLRVKIMGFATSVSLTGGRKVIILDEADKLSTATQRGLNGAIEEVAGNCSFIFTCNNINNIEDSIQSRCPAINFKLVGNDKTEMAKQFLERLRNILDTENVNYDNKVLVQIIMKFFPDYRRILGEIQHYSKGGSIDIGILAKFSETQVDELIKHLKNKDFKSVRTWVGNNSDSESSVIMRQIYDKAYDIVSPKSVPALVVLLGRYQYQASFCADQEINLMAFLTELMIETEIK
jgi:DNA polymerase III delta prime subunit